MANGGNDVPTQVRHVRTALARDYEPHLVSGGPEDEQRLRSRALAALAVRVVTGSDSASACEAVIDGHRDQGIDAIAIHDSPPHIYLVQAKWSDEGKGSFNRTAALALKDGVDHIEEELFSQFNTRGAMLAERAKQYISQHAADVTLVIALMGTADLHEGVTEVLDNILLKYNRHGDRFDYRVLHAADFFNRVRADGQPEPVTLTVTMNQWLSLEHPNQAFYGVVPAEQVADWHAKNPSRLFDLNIRNPLGLTKTNGEIVKTLIERPANFWYFNNGITLLCDSLKRRYQYTAAPQNGWLELIASNASVVNGAQTVKAIAEAMQRNPRLAAGALVGVRVIETGGSKQFAKETTEATNLQNHVLPRDRVAVEFVHAEIRADMAAEDFAWEYTYRRGTPDPAPEVGCSLDEAALALACAHSNPEHAVRAGRSTDLLWERGPAGTYDVLFSDQPSAYQIQRSVLTLRRCREALHNIKPKLQGRAAAIAEHGEFFVVHMLFQWFGTRDIAEPRFPWDRDVLAKVADTTEDVLGRLVLQVDARFPGIAVSSIFADVAKCRALAHAVSIDMHSGVPVGALPEEYAPGPKVRKPRRKKTVAVLIDAGAISEGAPLELYLAVSTERTALETWLAEDPRRSQATWVNNRNRPILWAADGQQYSPSGLINRMWEWARWEGHPVANQGTDRWRVVGGDTLWVMSQKIYDEQEAVDQ